MLSGAIAYIGSQPPPHWRCYWSEMDDGVAWSLFSAQSIHGPVCLKDWYAPLQSN